jgi:hypothetical protein
MFSFMKRFFAPRMLSVEERIAHLQLLADRLRTQLEFADQIKVREQLVEVIQSLCMARRENIAELKQKLVSVYLNLYDNLPSEQADRFMKLKMEIIQQIRVMERMIEQDLSASRFEVVEIQLARMFA